MYVFAHFDDDRFSIFFLSTPAIISREDKMPEIRIDIIKQNSSKYSNLFTRKSYSKWLIIFGRLLNRTHYEYNISYIADNEY